LIGLALYNTVKHNIKLEKVRHKTTQLFSLFWVQH